MKRMDAVVLNNIVILIQYPENILVISDVVQGKNSTGNTKSHTVEWNSFRFCNVYHTYLSLYVVFVSLSS